MSRVRFYRVALLCLAIPFSLTFTAWGQSDYGSIGGFVKDPSGAVVPKAKVSARNEATGQVTVATTNDAGYYVTTNLQPGYYTVTSEASGFKKFKCTHNKLDANSALSLDASLSVGASTETVEVVASAVVLQTESASVQNEIGARQVLDQELNGRNPVYMAQFLPGVRGGSTLGDFNFASTGGQSWQINGARTWDTVVTFDGAPAVRTRANGAVIGVADDGHDARDSDHDRGLRGRIGARRGRADPPRHQERHARFSRDIVRVFPQFGDECEYLVAQSFDSDQLRVAVPVQQFRRHGGRTDLGAGTAGEMARKAVLLCRRGLDSVPRYRHTDSGCPDGSDAAG
jgi:hypothetical protein